MSETWTNRIVDQGVADPEQLLANPKNWRIHPRHQQAALKAVLGRVGWVQDVIVNSETGYVLDGHLRVSLAISNGEQEIPVSYVALTEREEDLVLASLDPVSGLATTDPDALTRLMNADTGHELEELFAPDAGDDEFRVHERHHGNGDGPPGEPDEDDAPSTVDYLVMCPECGHEFTAVVPV
jgi:hypothetical protein